PGQGACLMAEAPPSRSIVPVIARLLLAAVLLVPGMAGFAVFLLLAGTWVIQGFQYEVSDRQLVPPILFSAHFCFTFSVVTGGVVLRFARWRAAPTVSLVLAVVSALDIVFGNVLLIDALGVSGRSDMSGLILLSGIGVLIVSLPPFL